MRYADLVDRLEELGHSVVDVGDVDAPRVGCVDCTDEVEELSGRLRRRVHDATGEATPLVLGGDHSLSMGSVPGVADAVDGELGVLWFDAHGDFNTRETSPSGNIHGMSLAAVTGYGEFEGSDYDCVREENVAVVGVRSLDDGERDNLLDSDVTVYTMSDVDRRGVGVVVEEAMEVAAGDVDGLHFSMDVDCLDPDVAPGVGTPERGGVGYREAHLAMEIVAEHPSTLASVDVVEVNPVLDEVNRTADVAVDLVASLFGDDVI